MTHPKTMTAIRIEAPGGPDALAPVEIALPDPGPDEVLIRVAAAGINGPDLAQRRGHYDPPPGASPLPGLEVAGEIAAIGAAVSDWRQGDEVMALCNGGGYAEYVAVPAGQVLPVPTGWSLAEAAALPETWFTVTQTLLMRAGLERGMTVLVHGAAGGIGNAAIAIARACGCRVIGVVSSPAKADYVLGLGAEATIDRRRDDLVARVMALTDGGGADRILDVAGGATAAANVRASARNGHILQVSTLAGAEAPVPLRLMMARQVTLSGSTLRPQDSATKAAIARTIRETLWTALEDKSLLRPRLAKHALEQAAEAHRAMESPDHMGKIVLETGWGRSLVR